MKRNKKYATVDEFCTKSENKRNFFCFRKRNKIKSKNFFPDARDCNAKNGSDRISSTFQNMCQKRYKAAKDVSKNIYNKLLHHYNFTYSFSTVVYSDRYFIYNLTLNTKIVPAKGLMIDDLNNLTLYKRFARNCNNYIDVLNLCESKDTYTKHYMPMFTNWSIQPYSPSCGILYDFNDRLNTYFNADRRHYCYSIMENIQHMYEFNRSICPGYRSAIDMISCSKDLLDYDDYAYSHSKVNEITQNQIKSFFYCERRSFEYRLSSKGASPLSRFTDSEIKSKKKGFKKTNSYGQIYNVKYISKFPVPDFALSQDETVNRWSNAIYEKSKALDGKEIYEKLYKSDKHISISNLVRSESELKTKIYSDKKKALFNENQNKVKNNKKNFDYEKSKINNFDMRKELKNTDITSLSRNMNNIIRTSYQDRSNVLVMEPLLFIQNLNEERLKNKIITSKKAQRLMVHIIIGYTISFLILSLISFYVLYFA